MRCPSGKTVGDSAAGQPKPRCGVSLPPNACGLVRLSLGLMLVFVAFQEMQNVAPEELKQYGLGSLGSSSLAVYYFIGMLVSLATPAVIRHYGARRMMPVGAVALAAYCAMFAALLCAPQVLPRFATVGFVAAVTIIATPVAMVIFPAQGYFITHYAPPHLLNRYTSFFSLCFFAAGLVGPAVVSTMLAVTSASAAVLLLVLLACAGVALVVRLPASEAGCGAPPEEGPEQIDEQTLVARDIEASQDVDPVRGAHSMCWAKVVLVKAAQSTLDALALLRETRARCLVFLCLAEGLVLNAFVSQVLPLVASHWHTTVDANGEEQHLQLALMQNGLGHLVACIVYAPLADRFGRRCLLLVQLVCVCLAALCLMCQLNTGSFPWVLPGSFFVGLSVVLCRIGDSALTSAAFPECAAFAFALMSWARSLGSVLGFVVFPRLPASMLPGLILCPLAILAVATVVAVACGELFEEDSKTTASEKIFQEEQPEGLDQLEPQPAARVELVRDGPEASLARDLEANRAPPCRLALLSNYVDWVGGILAEPFLGNYSEVMVVSANPAVGDFCRQHGFLFEAFPKCSEPLAFLRVCKNDPDYQASVDELYDKVHKFNPEVLLTAGFYVLPQRALDIATLAAINMHPADLPKYRGGFAMQAQILRGEPSYKVCVHGLSEVVDDPSQIMALSDPLPLGPRSAFATELPAIFAVSGKLLATTLARIYATPAIADGAAAVASPHGGGDKLVFDAALPHAFGIRTEKVTDPADGEVKKSNAGVLSRMRIEWHEDSALDIDRAVRAFFGFLSGAFTDVDGSAWAVDSCHVLGEHVPQVGTAAAPMPGTLLVVAEGLSGDAGFVEVATCDGRVVRLSGNFVEATAAPSLQAGMCFQSVVPLSRVIKMTHLSPDRLPFGTRYA